MIYLYLLEKRPFCFMNIHIHIINSVIPMGQIPTLYGLRYIKNITFSNMHMKIKAKYMIISCGKNLTYCVVLNTNFTCPVYSISTKWKYEYHNIQWYNITKSHKTLDPWKPFKHTGVTIGHFRQCLVFQRRSVLGPW